MKNMETFNVYTYLQTTFVSLEMPESKQGIVEMKVFALIYSSSVNNAKIVILRKSSYINIYVLHDTKRS